MKASKLLMPGSEKSSDAKNSSIFGLSEHFLPKKQKWPKRFFSFAPKKNWNTFLRQQMRKNISEKDLETAASFFTHRRNLVQVLSRIFFSFSSQKIFSLEKVLDQNVSIFLTRCTLNTIVSYAKTRIPHNPGRASWHSCHCKNSD